MIPGKHSSSWPCGGIFLSIFVPLTISTILLFHFEPFDPAPYPHHEFSYHQRQSYLTYNYQVLPPPLITRWLLSKSELIVHGQVLGAEDLAYDPVLGVLYTGCADGWIKRVKVNESSAGTDESELVVEELVNTGGRPLGIVLARSSGGGGDSYNELIIADAVKGLLKLTEDKQLILLSDEAEGHKFKLTDGVDIANDGIIYFTDASYKYGPQETTYDMLEGRQYGRLMSYNPDTKQTTVLLSDLYFPNGVVVSPDQYSLIFCETPMRRCKKYFLRGNRKGSTEVFIENLPGQPDNIHYDEEGYYWIGIPASQPAFMQKAMVSPLVRKALGIVEKYIGLSLLQKYGGVLVVDTEGKPIHHFYDLRLSVITSGIRVKNHLYCGSIAYPYILRLDLTKYPVHT